ncbi:MAG: alpha/beta hydrolase [Candidatus Falkowbacteria bacterium]|nr:alpha/beta hydrolase [Candidatus Falkowbacteria bacterium]
MKEFYFLGKNIYYRINAFKATKLTLVFVHGLSGSSSAWVKYEKELKKSFNILTFDLRGHGKSKKIKDYEAYKIESLAKDLFDLTEFLKIKKFILISHSLGCFVALAFLMKHQNKVLKAAFLSPNFSTKGMLSAKIMRPLLATGVYLFKYLPFPEKVHRHIDYSKYPNGGDWNIPRSIADVRNTSLPVYVYTTKQTYDFDAEDFLGKINIPILIIHGKKDTVFPVERGIMMAKKIKGSKLVILEDANHIIVLNKSEEVLKEIKKFVIS